MKLVVVESPAKAKTIEKYLGKGYKVIASKGHVLDLPKSELGIDVEKKFKPKYEIKNKPALDNIKKEFKKADSLILAVDPDREGEAIGWHIAKALKLIKSDGSRVSLEQKPLQRIVFTEITKDAVQAAVQNPREIDMDLVNAQQTRRILDRLVGYQLSPLLWRKLMFGLSAGRVQSVALRLVVEKELEREAFKSSEFWSFVAFLKEKQTTKKMKINLNKKSDLDVEEKSSEEVNPGLKFNLVSFLSKKIEIQNEEQARKIIDKLKPSDWLIKDIITKSSKRSPNPPFNTSTLQQASANQLGMGASRTMKVAQMLYEKGLITYMRTDSFNLSDQAIGSIAKYIKKEFGETYLSPLPRIYKTKSKVAQEAHEAIRPSDFNKIAKSLDIPYDLQRLYDLIWKRTVACQMADALVESATVSIDVEGYGFTLIGQKVLFTGFLSVHSEKVKEYELPKLKIGQKLYPVEIDANQKFTEPPARFSEATLIKALEANGIGRPSTYAPILTNIISKKYIEKEGKFLKPSLVGRTLSRLLTDHFPKIVDIQFTAGMEDDLDNIANGEKNWLEFLAEFYKDFSKSLTKGQKDIVKNDYLILGKSKEKCPICSKLMEIKLGRFSPFLSCVDFPKCKGMLSLSQREEVKVDTKAPDFVSKYKESPKTEDLRDYLLKQSRFGYFWAHPDYPKIKDTKPLELTQDFQDKLFGKAPKGKSGKVLELRRSKFGYFWAHPNYPDVKEIEKIDNKKLKEKKEELGLLG